MDSSPTEIVDSILREIILEDTEWDPNDFERIPKQSFTRTLKHVCPRWRDILTAMPVVWADIRIFDFCLPQVDTVRLAISRAHTVPLQIWTYHPSPVLATDMCAFSPILVDIMGVSGKWQDLRIVTDSETFDRIYAHSAPKNPPLRGPRAHRLSELTIQ